MHRHCELVPALQQLRREQLVCGLADFLLCIQLEQRVLFREFALPALPASRALSNTPPPFSPRLT